MSIRIVETPRVSEIAEQEDFGEIERILYEDGIELEALKHFFLYNTVKLGHGMIMYRTFTYLLGKGRVCPEMTISDENRGPKKLEEMLSRHLVHLYAEEPYTIITAPGQSGDVKEAAESLGYKVEVLSPKKT